MAKKASKLASAGEYEMAAAYYYDALLRNDKNIDARLGLKRNGQMVLDDLLEKFYKFHAINDHKASVYSFLDAKNYFKKLSRVSVKLTYPVYYDDYFEENKKVYLTSLYQTANQHLEEEEYSEAQKKYDEIIRLSPNYKDVSERRKVSVLEPIYLKGLQAFEAESYRKAYDYFTKVTTQDASYKDATDFQEQAIIKGRFTLALLPFQNLTPHRNVEEKIAAYFMDGMVNSGNPFVKLVDRENTDKLLEEQKLGLSGVIDDNTAAEAGALLGVKAVLTGKLVAYKAKKGETERISKKVKEGYKVKIYVDSTDSYHAETRFRPAKYFEYKKSNSVLLTFQYNLISSETGEILHSDLIEKRLEDKVHYARYKGNYKNLYPIEEGGLFGYSRRRNLHRLFQSRHELESLESMSQRAFGKVAQEVVKGISDYEKRRDQ
ncbi:CsgG/HfaB family protein [Xanthovirga aplysinae]|uniref:CsgG/HfaB family protein n=1 Tax=Xanthovirga aplysinae TaxID=2529853 RepID=UPI00165736D8|nr:CsgG/HfaB family protein [Xanthovirga aplysinae]